MGNVYLYEHIWGGYSIIRGERGFVVESWTTVKGYVSGGKRLYYYGRDGIGADTDFEAPWKKDKYGRKRTVAEHILDVIQDDKGTFLSAGTKVT